MKKLLMFLLLGLFIISFASALELEKIGYDWDNVEEFTKDKATSKYGKYEIRNTILGIPFLELSKVADIELKNNSDVCGRDCFAEKEITLYEDGILIDEVTFETLQEDGGWVHQPIRNYQFNYWGEIESYKEVCSKVGEYGNGTNIEECSVVEDGTYLGWVDYQEGEVVEAGTYLLRLDGQKNPSRTIDWKVKTNGILTENWAIWGNISEGDDAEVILNSPPNNNISLIPLTTFNCSANVTGGALITNMSLYTNQSGTWEIKNTTTFSDASSVDLISYLRMEESTGNLSDSSGNGNDGIVGGDLPTQIVGKIDFGQDFDGTGDWVNMGDIMDTGVFTANCWIKPDVVENNIQFLSKNVAGDSGFRLFEKTGAILTFEIQENANEYTITTTDKFAVDAWNMITILRRNNGTAEVYINGTSSGHNDTTTYKTNNIDLKIGGLAGSSNVNGKYDECGFWDRDLNASEISDLYNSGIGSRPGDTSATETWSRDITKETLWTCEACDSDSDCGFAEENRTVFLDTAGASISVETPVGVLGYGTIGLNETLNVTFTDGNLDSCWYNYNGTNITIDNCLTGVKNSTTFILETGNTNMTIYANDSIGNSNSTFIQWSYNLTETSQTYPETSVESAVETYVANLSYNSSNFGVISGILTLNDTEYLGTRTGTGDSANFSADATMPSVTEETNITAYWTISLTDGDGTNEYNLTSHNVTVSIINLSLCDASNNIPFWNFTIYNESNVVEINSTFEVTFAIRSQGSSEDNLFSFQDAVGNDSQFDFCLSPSSESYVADASIKLTKAGFVDKFYNYQEVALTNSTREDSLYMLADDDSTSFIVHVVYVDSSDIVGAEVQVQRYYPGTGTWVTTEILTTNDVGESVGHLLSEDADYKFLVYQGGVSIYNSTSTKITCAVAPCTVTLTVPIDVPSGTEVVENLVSSLTHSSTTNVFTYTYADTSGDFSLARLYVNRVVPSNASIAVVCNETKTTSSGVMTCDISGEVNGTYSASGYITRTGDEFLDRRISASLGTRIYNAMGDDGVLWAFFIFMGVAMLGISRPSLAIVFGTVGLIVLSILEIINIGALSIVAVSSIAVILLMRIGRE